MGNQNKNHKKEDNDISDIRYYIEYLNQEKKRNFEQIIPERKKSTSLFNKKVCDPSACSNLLSFSIKKVQFVLLFIKLNYRSIGKKTLWKNANIYPNLLSGVKFSQKKFPSLKGTMINTIKWK